MMIVYLSTSRLPTQKAYGVTVLESFKAARKLGIDIEVFSPGSKSDQIADQINFVPSLKFPSFLRHASISRLRLSLFRLNSVLIPLVASNAGAFRQSEFIWLRDPTSALILGIIKPHKKILLEVHHRPTGLSVSLFKILSTMKNLRFAAISPKLISQIQDDVPGIKVFEAPMGVPDSFFSSRRSDIESWITRFLYIGKGESSGFDNGLQVFVNDFARALKLSPQISITFLGLERRYRESITMQLLDLGVSDEKVKFIDHVPHSQVSTILSEHDVGVLPYLASTYNNERFPIKSLEYAASELSIIASDIDSHRTIIGQKNAFFYNPGQLNSFESQVAQIINDSVLRADKTASAKSWALGFTYEKRIERLVNQWLGEYL